MKKHSVKALGILISAIIVSSSIAIAFSVNAENVFTKGNLLKGKYPVTFTSANSGGTTYNWTGIRIDDDGSKANYWGYDIPFGQSADQYDAFKQYTGVLTDEKSDTAQWIQPEYRYPDRYDDFIITYEFSEGTNFEGFSVDTDSAVSKSLKVYAADSYADLFKNLVAEATTDSLSIEKDLATINSKYISFVFTKPGYNISEIAVYGETNTTPNVLSEKLPVTFTSANSGETTYNWTGIRIDNDGSKPCYASYDIPFGQAAGEFDILKPYTATLTDENKDTVQWIQPEWRYPDRYDDFVITYQFEDVTNFNGFTVNTDSIASKTVKVYASDSYTDLFQNLVASVTTENSVVLNTLETINSKYVSFVFVKPGYNVSEIAVYGERNTTSNVLKEKIPVTFTSVNSGETTYNWTGIRIDNDGSKPNYGSYDIPFGQAADQYDVLKSYTGTLTDEDKDTVQWIQPEYRYPDRYDDFVITYQFEDSTNFDSFVIKTDSTLSKTIKVYASDSYANLFKNLVSDVTTGNSSITKNLETVNSKYISFVFTNPGYNVSEIAVYGEKNTSPNVVKEKLPITFTSANSGETTYNWTGIRIDNDGSKPNSWGYDIPFGQNTGNFDVLKLNTGTLTDEKTDTVQWIQPEYRYPDRYDDFVITYELNNADLESFFIGTDSQISKTVKVFASDKYSDLFNNLIGTYTADTSNIFKKIKADDINFISFVFVKPQYNVSEVSVFGEDNAVKFTKPNVLKEKLPVTFTSANSGGTTYNWTGIRIDNDGSKPNSWGYDIPFGQAADQCDVLKSNTGTLTDEKADTAQWIQPEYRYPDRYDDFVITYELNKIDVEGFTINTDAPGLSKTVKVYSSDKYSDLFSNLIGTFTGEGSNIAKKISAEDSNFISFVFTKPGYNVTEISLYGENDDVNFAKPNVLKGEIPITYSSAAVGGTSFNWTATRVDNSGSESSKKLGYEISIGEGVSDYDSWVPYVEKLTDEDLNTKQWIQPEWCYDGDNYHDFVITYETNSVDIEGFTIKTDAIGSSKTVKMYASDSYSSLFNNAIATITTDQSVISSPVSTTNSKYIAFVFTKPGYNVSEISVHGDFEATVPSSSPNVLKNNIPIFYSSAKTGLTNFHWDNIKYGTANDEMSVGYSAIDNLCMDAYDTWKPYLSKLTDESVDTKLWVQPDWRYTGIRYDDIVATYKIPDTVIDGIKLNGVFGRNVKVYAAVNAGSLYTPQSLIAEINSYEPNTYVKINNERAKYVAFVFDAPQCYISELAVYGTDYIRPNYGTNLILNKDPMSLFISKREYPIAPSGDRMYAPNDQGEVLMDVISETMGLLTDNDFEVKKDWLHDNANEYMTTTSRYKVIAYDFGSVSQLNKVLIDSDLAGYDIYVSSDFTKLYDKSNRIYTSGGDKLLPNGELDPSTDLDAGENLIDVAGTTGRYMGIVITRSAKIGVICWDSVRIREIQAYGQAGNADFGNNLISGKVPLFIYRAAYEDYSTPVEMVSVREGGAGAYTNGVKYSEAVIQLPHAGGALNYNFGGCVMVYYLEGTCDIKAFAMHSGYYYAPGGIDLFVSESYDTLFDKENQVFTTYGEKAEEGVYDASKSMGSLSLSASLDSTKRGRYVAFVITRTYDVGTFGASGLLRLGELELFGDFLGSEQLPETIVNDQASGGTATFNYQNPDDRFDFEGKGISSFRFVTVAPSEYKTDLFDNAMQLNRFKMVREPFTLEFLDKNNKVIPHSKLADENITFEFKLNNSNFTRLGEIRNGSIYIVPQGQQYGDKMVITLEDLDHVFCFLSIEDASYNGIITEENSDFINNQTSQDAYNNTNNTPTYNQIIDNDFSDDKLADDVLTEDKPKSNKKWVVVNEKDPLEWLWNIYDTFAENIWMLVVCVVIVVAATGGIVAQVIFYKKRKN